MDIEDTLSSIAPFRDELQKVDARYDGWSFIELFLRQVSHLIQLQDGNLGG
jgi:hypothetical protein